MSIRLAKQRIAAFRRVGVPIVTVDATAAGVPQTVIDDVAGGRLATAHLLGLGHRRIGFVGDAARCAGHELGFTSSRSRLQGYRRELAEAGIDFDPGLVRLGPHSALVAAEHWPANCCGWPTRPPRSSRPPTPRRWACCARREQHGFPVPGRLSVVGFDDIESAALLNLSTVHQPLEQSGAEGARRLCASAERCAESSRCASNCRCA